MDDYTPPYPTDAVPQKQCPRCKNVYPATSEYFHKRSKNKPALETRCKTCKNASNREYNKSPAGKVSMNNAGKRYRMGDHWKEIRREKEARYYIKSHDKKRARATVTEAVRKGQLPAVASLACVLCGELAQEYHHHSYEREYWLDVIPLCKACHRKVHADDGV